MIEKMTKWIIGLTIGGLILMGLLVPVISMSTDTEATHINEGMRFSVYEPGTTHTIVLDKDGITTDGKLQPYTNTWYKGESTIMFGDNVLRLTNYGTLREYLHLSGTYADRRIGTDIFTTNSVTIEIHDDGLATIMPATGDTARNLSNVVMYPDPEGEYSLSYTPQVVADSTIYGAGTTAQGNVVYGLRFTGNTTAVAFTILNPIGGTVEEYAVNTTNTATNLYKIDNVDVSVTGASEALQYSYIFAPYSVTYDNPQYIGATYSSIMAIVPIMVIVCIIVYAAAGIKSKY